jgi:AcrR family transcriptional regulator
MKKADTTRSRRAPTRLERKIQTRSDLIAAAQRLFMRDGFHATSVGAIADEAGYTTGAVYSNFVDKEDLFFAVYEQRVIARATELNRLLDEAPSATAAVRGWVETLRGREDGWLAVFFEFWAHVLRHPEQRERFAELHRRALEPFVRAAGKLADEQRVAPPLPPALMATAQLALVTGMQLERLTRPEEIDVEAIRKASELLAWGPNPPARKRDQ